MAMLNNQRVIDVSNEKFHVFSQPAGHRRPTGRGLLPLQEPPRLEERSGDRVRENPGLKHVETYWHLWF